MRIIVSLHVPELDSEARRTLKDRLNSECKRLCIAQTYIFDNEPLESIDINVSRVSASGIGSLIGFAKAVLRDVLNL